ncbi:hypothetical protein AB1M95_00660 [Sulfitobacter sp. LCG007]
MGEVALINACTVDDCSVIGSRVVVLDGSRIGPGTVLATGSVLYTHSMLEGGWLHSRSAARPAAGVTSGELANWRRKLRASSGFCAAEISAKVVLRCFVAPSASVSGKVIVGEDISIWYGWRLDAGNNAIRIGASTNFQDTSVLRCEGGEDVTIGQNVTLTHCKVAPRCLVGIGARIARGAEVETDVLVAAGAETE